MTKPIDKARLDQICKIGQGNDCCRYIILSHKGLCCAKNTELSHAIDIKVFKNEMVAKGDNCEGL